MASAQKDSGTASRATSQNTGNIFSTRRLAIRKKRYKMSLEMVDLDLLIIDYIVIHPEFRGLGIAESAIHRIIDIFGTACGLVACKPWPLQFTPSIANDPKALKRLALPDVSEGEAIRKVRSYWSRLGFWPIRNTGIYVLSRSQRA